MAKKPTTPTVEKYGKTYPCEIVRSTPTKHVVRFTQASGKVVERTVPKEDVKGYVEPAAAPKAPKPAAAAKPAAAPASDVVEIKPWAATLADLTAVQAQIDEANLSERRDAADPLIVRRNELILAAIAQGAGFAEIARARGVSSSTNRGLIRVLQGGKRL